MTRNYRQDSKPMSSTPCTFTVFCRCCCTPPRTRISSLSARHHTSTTSHTRLSYLAIPRTQSSKSSPQKSFRIISTTSKMSFSNTEVPGDKPADPYKATNKDDPELKAKIEDLTSFISSCKFGMMTTRIGSTGQLTSRCMALAAKVRPPPKIFHSLLRTN